VITGFFDKPGFPQETHPVSVVKSGSYLKITHCQFAKSSYKDLLSLFGCLDDNWFIQ